jgi:dephospho-CoA kinase
MLRVGLTGGIACGKSAVLRRLQAFGFQTLDLDQVAHELLAPGGGAHRLVLEAFGPSIRREDGTIDRKALGAIVFADDLERRRLNGIVHPLVRLEEARWAREAGQRSRILVTDAALLVESGMHLRFDRLVVVFCSPEEQLRRLQARDGLSEAEARARIEAQMPIAEKRTFGHLEIDTSGSQQETARGAESLARTLESMVSVLPIPREISPSRAHAGLLWGPPTGPGGLTPLALLDEIGAARGLEMERVLTLLRPRRVGPWYRAGQGGGVAAETLAVPLVLFAIARGAPDSSYLVAAARALATLTHASPEERAAACLGSLFLSHVALSRGTPTGIEDAWPAWVATATRWGGAEPPERLRDLVPRFRASLSRAERGDFIGGALGLLRGVPESSVPKPVKKAVQSLRELHEVREARVDGH